MKIALELEPKVPCKPNHRAGPEEEERSSAGTGPGWVGVPTQ